MMPTGGFVSPPLSNLCMSANLLSNILLSLSLKTIFAVDRTRLNGCLLDTLARTPNVKFFFSHKLTGADFRARKAWFEVQDSGAKTTGRAREIEIDFDFMIGADGAHSSVRYHLMKYARMDYQQEYIDALWCEFHLEPRKESSPEDPMSRFAISPNHLHIWPGKDFMFIAIPSEVRTIPVRLQIRATDRRNRMGHSHARSSCRPLNMPA